MMIWGSGSGGGKMADVDRMPVGSSQPPLLRARYRQVSVNPCHRAGSVLMRLLGVISGRISDSVYL